MEAGSAEVSDGPYTVSPPSNRALGGGDRQ